MSPETAPTRNDPPLVLVPCCRRIHAELPFHMVSERYVSAVLDAVGGLPLLVPAMGERALLLLDRFDGLLLTGSPSNIEPHRYDGPPEPDDNPTDPARDATTLPLIRAAVARGMPVLGICRGLQELNVALGGTLHQELHRVPGRLDHRSDKTVPLIERYRRRHMAALVPGSTCAAIAGTETILVNSLHGQGIDRLAPGLVPEAHAPDSQIEAVRLSGAGFVMAVQWHPEWTLGEDRFSAGLFESFGDACRRYRERAVARGRAA